MYNIIPLIGFILAFTVLIVLLIAKVELGLTLFMCSLVVGLFSLSIGEYLTIILNTISDYYTLNLMAIAFAIMVLTTLYEVTGYIKVLGNTLLTMFRNKKLLLMTVPAIIGLLPVAGGALMSAPLIEQPGKSLGLSQDKLTFVNVWFRHLIFMVYPLSQFLILTSALSHVPITTLILNQLPILLFMFLVGYLISLRGLRNKSKQLEQGTSFSLSMIKPLLPIIIPIILAIGLRLNIALSVVIGVIILAFLAKANGESIARVFKSKRIYTILLVVFSAMLLKNVIKDSGLSTTISSILSSMNIPVILSLIGIVVPIGFLMGTPSGTVAITISILSDVIVENPKATSLVYVATYLSYLGSPAHLCLILSVKYYKAQLARVYGYLLPAIIATLIFTIIMYMLVW